MAFDSGVVQLVVRILVPDWLEAVAGVCSELGISSVGCLELGIASVGCSSGDFASAEISRVRGMGGLRTGLVVNQRPSRCRCISISDNVVP